jgi:hypothetical protein
VEKLQKENNRELLLRQFGLKLKLQDNAKQPETHVEMYSFTSSRHFATLPPGAEGTARIKNK